MIAALAIRTGIAPSVLAEERPRYIQAMVELLQDDGGQEPWEQHLDALNARSRVN